MEHEEETNPASKVQKHRERSDSGSSTTAHAKSRSAETDTEKMAALHLETEPNSFIGESTGRTGESIPHLPPCQFLPNFNRRDGSQSGFEMPYHRY